MSVQKLINLKNKIKLKSEVYKSIKIIAVSVPPIMRSKKALRLFGPRAFGLPFDYTPVEKINT